VAEEHLPTHSIPCVSPSGGSSLHGVPTPSLRPDEREIGSFRANMTQGRLAVGGRLVLTNQRVVFSPRTLVKGPEGDPWECEHNAITDVGLAERGLNPFDGSLRRRLRIEHHGTVDLFVVSKAKSVAAAIRHATLR
jgi:hypothetical protein